MAPEVFRHEPYNSQVDVYSFAMILYECVYGVRPFHMMDPISAAMAAATYDMRPDLPPKSPATFSEAEHALLPAVNQMIKRCWSAAPSDRYAVILI
jgi:serine/threonine protein kinase